MRRDHHHDNRHAVESTIYCKDISTGKQASHTLQKSHLERSRLGVSTRFTLTASRQGCRKKSTFNISPIDAPPETLPINYLTQISVRRPIRQYLGKLTLLPANGVQAWRRAAGAKWPPLQRLIYVSKMAKDTHSSCVDGDCGMTMGKEGRAVRARCLTVSGVEVCQELNKYCAGSSMFESVSAAHSLYSLPFLYFPVPSST